MKNVKVNEAVQIASIGKRMGGFLIDFGITFVLYLTLLYSLGANVLSSSFGAKQDTANYFAYATDSGLFEYTDHTKSLIQVVGASSSASSSNSDSEPARLYEKAYYPALKHFYCDFLVNDERIDNRKEAGREYLYTTVFGLPSFDSVEGLSVATSDEKLYGNSSYYRYALNDSGVVDLSADIVLQDQYQKIIDGEKKEEKTKLINELNAYYYSSKDSLIYKANESLLNQNYYRTISDHSKMANWSIRLICYLPISFTIFALIPLLFKNGETLGKLATKTCLATSEGYQVTMKEKIIRSCFMFLFTSVCVIAPVSYLYLFSAFSLLCLLDYIIMILGKDDRLLSLEDRISKTIVISKPHSQIFVDVSDKESHFSNKGQTQKEMDGYRENHVIEVDSVPKSDE